MRGLREPRLRQMQHEAMRMSREVHPRGDLVEAYAKYGNALIGAELRKPFPDWDRVHRLAVNLADAANEVR